MSVDNILLLGRILFILALYVFLGLLALLLLRELKQRSARTDERAPADLLVIEPYETGLDPGERIPLLAVTKIGRDAENDVVLQDTFVSGEHAQLNWNGSGWVLRDFNSTNGTRVNDKQVVRPLAVKPNDVLEFGRVKVKLVPV